MLKKLIFNAKTLKIVSQNQASTLENNKRDKKLKPEINKNSNAFHQYEHVYK